MVVYEYYSGGGIADYRVKHLAGMDEGGCKRAFGNFNFAHFAVFVIQQHDIKQFAFLPPEILAKVLIDIFGRAERLSGFPFSAADSFADLERCFQLGDFRRPDAFDGGDFARRRSLDTPETAELI